MNAYIFFKCVDFLFTLDTIDNVCLVYGNFCVEISAQIKEYWMSVNVVYELLPIFFIQLVNKYLVQLAFASSSTTST